MTTLYLIRHGQAAAGWDQDPDPGLSDLGWRQAEAVRHQFASLPAAPLFSSPLRRARETAQPLAQCWGAGIDILPAFAEIPAPVGYSLEQRLQWLMELRHQRWSSAYSDLLQWREGIHVGLQSLPAGALVFTHFMVMNVVVGLATSNDQYVCYQPDNGSVLQLQMREGEILILEKGAEATSKVL